MVLANVGLGVRVGVGVAGNGVNVGKIGSGVNVGTFGTNVAVDVGVGIDDVAVAVGFIAVAIETTGVEVWVGVVVAVRIAVFKAKGIWVEVGDIGGVADGKDTFASNGTAGVSTFTTDMGTPVGVGVIRIVAANTGVGLIATDEAGCGAASPHAIINIMLNVTSSFRNHPESRNSSEIIRLQT